MWCACGSRMRRAGWAARRRWVALGSRGGVRNLCGGRGMFGGGRVGCSRRAGGAVGGVGGGAGGKVRGRWVEGGPAAGVFSRGADGGATAAGAFWAVRADADRAEREGAAGGGDQHHGAYSIQSGADR